MILKRCNLLEEADRDIFLHELDTGKEDRFLSSFSTFPGLGRGRTVEVER